MDGGEWFTLELPAPPSVNRFTKKLGNKSPEVIRWANIADKYLYLKRHYLRLSCEFELSITWSASNFKKSDIDNRVKPLLDWLQRVEVISNDKLCRKLTVEWGWAPEGCLLKIRKWQNA